MLNRGWAALLLAAGLAGTAMAADGFEKLYNGKDFTGWWAKNGKIETWKVEDGIIVTPMTGGGWLTSDKEYGDFVLKADWKITPGGNSGIGLRYPKEGNGSPHLDGVEIQLLDDDADKHKNLKPYQYTGSVYGVSGPTKRAAKAPGEWNRIEIKCQGPIIEIKINDQLVNRVNGDEFTQPVDEFKPLRGRPLKGHIGFQAYGPRSEFRNIEIRELK